ncbi:MAG: hypothetical protein J4G00_09065 [Actinomycetia bacterium]|nr:hypothetical protein [Actinomycetes bacterium]
MTVRLFGISLKVKLSFLIVICLLGMPLIRNVNTDPLTLAGRLGIWVAVVMVSVIVHELGHALLARRFGARVSMELWALGGLTSWQPGPKPITPARRAAIAASGSALGFVVGGAAFPLWKLVPPGSGALSLTLGWVVWVNLGWGLINWLPIRLLDGGHIFQGVIEVLWPKRADAIERVFFLCSSAAAALVAFHLGLPIAALFAGAMFIMEVRALVAPNRSPRPPVQPPPSDHFLLQPPPPGADRPRRRRNPWRNTPDG